ncbi:hypothetical protein ACWEPZ_31345 [Streptomyces sp. NPDC004288]
MPRGSSPQRERQHIKESAEGREESPKRAEGIVVGTVDKERARSGESRTASGTSARETLSSKRDGQRSSGGARGPR